MLSMSASRKHPSRARAVATSDNREGRKD
uniref:Uncharacterized protein n=1 Tax=Arundo donax TaxID=35708 RepID=A0A0A9C8J9_ARUDO